MFLGGIPYSFKMNAMAYGGIWGLMQVVSLAEADPSVGGVAWMAHVGGCIAGALLILVIRSELNIELVDSSSGSLDVKHESDQPEISEEQILEQILDMNPVTEVVTEFIGEDSSVPCRQMS